MQFPYENTPTTHFADNQNIRTIECMLENEHWCGKQFKQEGTGLYRNLIMIYKQ